MPQQPEMWEKLGTEVVDILIIGGGIIGAGIARDATMRGMKVALVEMKDIAYGTSSRSSKLVHGGLRYLEQFEFSLVFESVSERRILLDIAPHIVKPMGFVFPVYKSSGQSFTKISAGMWVYDGLSLFRSPKRHRKLKPADVRKEEPCLQSEGLKGAPLFYDCATDDARLTLENALDAAAQGATVATWSKMVSAIKDDNGRMQGVVVKNMFTGGLKEVHAHAIINATGPWTDRVLAMSGDHTNPVLRPTKGVHIVVPHSRIPVNNAVCLLHPTDNRPLFAIPWGDRTYLGTTDTDYEGNPSSVFANLWDVDYIIDTANHYFPDCALAREDVVSTWAGLRPLIKPRDNGVSESKVSREHEIIITPDGLITVAGGKLTTYRKMSAEVVDTAVQMLRLTDHLPALHAAKTDSNPLPGGVDWPEDDDAGVVAARIAEASDNELSDTTCNLLARTYGMRGVQVARLANDDATLAEPIIDGRAEIMAQVAWGVTEELAATLSDIFIQRTQIFYRDTNQGLDSVEKVADRMATLLGWSPETRGEQVGRYRQDVALSRHWKTEIDNDAV